MIYYYEVMADELGYWFKNTLSRKIYNSKRIIA